MGVRGRGRAAATDASATSGRRTRSRPHGRQRARDAALLLPVPLLLLTVAFLLPTVLNLAYAFTDWSAFRDEIGFVGLENFTDLATDGILWQDLRITLLYAVAVTLLQNVLGLALALGLERSHRWNKALRALVFVPVLLSPLAVGFLWRGILSYDGVVNDVLAAIAGEAARVEWLGSPDWTLFVVAFVHSWKWMGLTALIYVAGLVTVPQELLEAARVDGASGWRLLRSIKMPLIAPAVTVNVALTLIGALNSFDVILSSTGGGPGRATEVLNVYVFQQFGNGAFGLATAMSLVLLLTVAVLAVPAVVLLRRREVDL